jgi:hypothetical protein
MEGAVIREKKIMIGFQTLVVIYEAAWVYIQRSFII